MVTTIFLVLLLKKCVQVLLRNGQSVEEVFPSPYPGWEKYGTDYSFIRTDSK